MKACQADINKDGRVSDIGNIATKVYVISAWNGKEANSEQEKPAKDQEDGKRKQNIPNTVDASFENTDKED